MLQNSRCVGFRDEATYSLRVFLNLCGSRAEGEPDFNSILRPGGGLRVYYQLLKNHPIFLKKYSSLQGYYRIVFFVFFFFFGGGGGWFRPVSPDIRTGRLYPKP